MHNHMFTTLKLSEVSVEFVNLHGYRGIPKVPANVICKNGLTIAIVGQISTPSRGRRCRECNVLA